MAKPRLLVFVVAYHAETTIRDVLTRLPASLATEYDTEILVIDDSSSDETFERSRQVALDGSVPFPVNVLFNPVNQGYGGNQKIGYHYAITHGFDYVALLHGDGQYAPESLPDLVRPLEDGSADACFGSRMMVAGAARRGGMPLYKFIGNKILSWFENRMLRTSFTEFHSGYRVYSVAALSKIPFELNTNDFHFDTEIIVQFVLAGLRIVERPIPTYYGDEICRVNGLKYARDVARAVLRAKGQSLGLFYDRRFDCVPANRENAQYRPKLDFDSPHAFVLQVIPPGARVLELGCAGGYLGSALKERGAFVAGVDIFPLDPRYTLDEFQIYDLNRGLPPTDLPRFDWVLLLDVIEHLSSPERFVEELRRLGSAKPDIKIIVSTANIGFIVTRLMLLAGQFNYGKRGILDLTHTRLFTFSSFRRLFEQCGFRVNDVRGMPGPFPLAISNPHLSRAMLAVNRLLIRVSRGLFSYQMLMVVQPNPTLEVLLQRAEARAAAGKKTA